MKLLITGATGLIGSSIVEQALNNKIEVHYLTTRKNKLNIILGATGFLWNPSIQEIDNQCFEGVDTIIHLAGSSISKKWTPENKKEIFDSRINSTQVLKKGIEESRKGKIKTIICASAIGIYPYSFDETFTEKNKIFQENYLQEIVIAWEKESRKLYSLSANFSIIRIGLVLSAHGGLLAKLALPVKLMAGAAFGSGRQWQSWIHISDLTLLIFECAKNSWKGIFNAVSPNPVSQRELIKGLGKVLNRPVFLPNIPSFIMKIFLGKRSILVLGSQKISSKLILEKGFSFHFPTLESALEDIYNKKR